MDDLPQIIKEEVRMKRCGSLLNKVHLFNDINMAELRKLSTMASIYCFSPGDIVLYAGNMGRELHCVRKGHVEVSNKKITVLVSFYGWAIKNLVIYFHMVGMTQENNRHKSLASMNTCGA